MGFFKRQAVFNVSISELNNTFYEIKVPVKVFKVWFGRKKPILDIFGTETPQLGTKLCSYELIFHTFIEETRINPFCVIKKKMILSSSLGEI